MPELEASKRAAAAARDFKTAAEVAAEAKAAAAEAAAADERVAALKQQAAAAADEEQQLQAAAAEAEAAVSAAATAAAKARWRGLLGAHAELQKELASADEGSGAAGESASGRWGAAGWEPACVALRPATTRQPRPAPGGCRRPALRAGRSGS